MLMVAKKENRYGGKRRSFGDEVEVKRADVRLVTALGWFVPMEDRRPAETKPTPARKTLHKKIMTPVPHGSTHAETEAPTNPAKAEDPPPLIVAPAPPEEPAAVEVPRGAYQRRDLRAED